MFKIVSLKMEASGKQLKQCSKTLVKKRKRRLVAMVAFLIFLILIISLNLYNSSFFDIEKIKVEGNNRLSKAEVIKVAKVRLGMNLFRVATKSIKSNLSNQPWIEAASVVKRYPRTLEIEIKERKPLAIIISNNVGYFVDRSQFVWRSDDEIGNLPLIRDFSIEIAVSSRKIESPQLKNALLCLEGLETNIKGLVSDVSVSSVEGLTLRLKNGILILYGKASEMKKKNYLIDLILSQAKLKREEIQIIDVRVPSHPVVRKGKIQVEER